jgi:hypothetical protein
MLNYHVKSDLVHVNSATLHIYMTHQDNGGERSGVNNYVSQHCPMRPLNTRESLQVALCTAYHWLPMLMLLELNNCLVLVKCLVVILRKEAKPLNIILTITAGLHSGIQHLQVAKDCGQEGFSAEK